MFTVGLGLLGATIIIMIFQNTASAILIGFGFGGSLLALFLRVGGGIFTKAADVGADLVGKVEAGIPEDDPRNPATIADNVGDNVGDCAGMAADLFESYEVTLVASIILGVAAFQSIGAEPCARSHLPARRPRHRRARVDRAVCSRCAPPTRTSRRWRRSTAGSSPPACSPSSAPRSSPSATSATTTFDAGWKCFGAVIIGLVLAQVLSRLTEYFTSTETAPVREIAEATRTGPATVVLSGISSGLESSVYAIIAICIALGVGIALGDGNIQFTFYLVALTGMGMLATTGVVVSEDTFGPVADNAAGIAEMSGEFEGEPERIMVSLDAVGNTTKAVTKGFAIGSAVIAVGRAVRLLHRDDRWRARPAQGPHRQQALQQPRSRRSTWPNPKMFIGLLIGGSIVVPLLRARHPRRRPHRRCGRAGGPPPVRRRRDHGGHQEARLRPGHRHLHRGVAAGARHAGAARRAHPAHHRLRHQLSTPSARSSPA